MVFEDVAADLLKKDSELKKKLEDEKIRKTKNWRPARGRNQTLFTAIRLISKNHLRYPVGGSC